jgi:hypothetical protein
MDREGWTGYLTGGKQRYLSVATDKGKRKKNTVEYSREMTASNSSAETLSPTRDTRAHSGSKPVPRRQDIKGEGIRIFLRLFR